MREIGRQRTSLKVQGKENRMSPLVRNLILSLGSAAVILGVLKGLVALPETLHQAGVVVPVTWVDVQR